MRRTTSWRLRAAVLAGAIVAAQVYATGGHAATAQSGEASARESMRPSAAVAALGQPASAPRSDAVSPNSPTPATVPPVAVFVQALPARVPSGITPTAHQDGHCNRDSLGNGDLCLWYHQNFQGSLADFFFADANLNDNTFITAGSGQHQLVGNNSASDYNYDLWLTARVCTGVSFTGTCADIGPGANGNLDTTFRNNIESFSWH
jgi:hypothetical protein